MESGLKNLANPDKLRDTVVLSLTERQRKIILFALHWFVSGAEDRVGWYSFDDAVESFMRDIRDGSELVDYLSDRFDL